MDRDISEKLLGFLSQTLQMDSWSGRDCLYFVDSNRILVTMVNVSKPYEGKILDSVIS